MPYPPNKGEKIRAFHILRHLAQRHRIYLGCFVDDPRDWRHVGELQALCAETHFEPLNPTRATIRAALGFLKRSSLSPAYFYKRQFEHWVGDMVNEHKPEAAVIYSSVMAQYLTGHLSQFTTVVLDFVDMDSEKWRQYAQTKAWPMSWVYRREATKLLAYDRQWAQLASSCTFVSEAEAQLFRNAAPELAGKTHAIANGVDSEFFTPDAVPAFDTDCQDPLVVFTGTMDYWPNEDAAIWFANDILPKVRQTYPKTRFYIVGAHPSRDVRSLATLEGVEVTGPVDDVRPYLVRADVVVVPMRLARGIQNKVLEGMAMGKPVVTTPEGLEGIEARPGEHLLVAEGADAFVEAILVAVQPMAGQKLGRAARQRVIEGYDWTSKLSSFEALLGL